MKLRLIMILSFCFIILVACSKEDSTQDTSDKETPELPEMIDVEILTEPGLDNLQPNETIAIQAKVTQGDELVNDADEVQFEFWKKDQEEEHEMIDGEFQGEGIYSIEKTVEEHGIYYVIAHVTARQMHNMPKLELTIGDADVSSTEEEKDDDHHEHAHGDHHDATGIVMHIQVDSTVQKDREISLISHIKQNGEALTDAEVEFEVWQEGQEKHEYVEATESVDGEYVTPYTFSNSGEYHIKLHFVKGDLHDHTQTTITVE
ncbi:hypothetical protein HNQ94_000218 [Salirhabdus euzebyi]|uniref:YtkA-like domain-containing protein n=1 Tax=Salirhabdus euzebyi TaxID=394506 RepID=A0A841PS83_9BACI|nr:FixH family protein [Salirhabdus euzebyi]MBB6451797.1 hypothetical protein [Salirhabdus euzebyi]